MENLKNKYHTELYNTITYYNKRNNTPLSNVNIWEVISQVTIKEEEEPIIEVNNVTDDTFSLGIIPQRENLNARFASERIKNSDKLVNAVANTRMKNVGYELNAAAVSDVQFKLASNPDVSTHTNNRTTHQN